MVTVALHFKLEAKPGKEKEVEQLLEDGGKLVSEEPGTIVWFAIRMGPSSFLIFDAFETEAGRHAHLSGKVAAAVMGKSAELFASPPDIDRIDLIAAKLPG
jgi:quinol monooxygenase YgiN